MLSLRAAALLIAGALCSLMLMLAPSRSATAETVARLANDLPSCTPVGAGVDPPGSPVGGPPGLAAAHSSAAEALPESRRLAEGVHLFAGLSGPPGPDNRARTGNVIVIIGTRGVLVWNSGASDRHGMALVAAIARLTDRPLSAVVLSEPGQDLVFGATAFARHGARVLMTAPATVTMRQRCNGCLAELRRLLGDCEMAGTRLPDPEPLDAQRREEVTDQIGRRLRWFDLGKAAIAGTIALHDLDSGILLAGPVAMVQRVGDIRDADLDGWRRGLTTLTALAPRLVVPDRGSIGGPSDLAKTLSYLDALDARVAALLAEGVTLGEVADRAALPAVSDGWQEDGRHRGNVHFRYLQLERRQLEEP